MTDSNPVTIEVTVPLPASIAEFGIAESIIIPESILEDWDTNGPINADAVTQRMIRAAQSLTMTLLRVLVMRSRNGSPLTYEKYVELHEQAREEVARVAALEETPAVDDGDPQTVAAVAELTRVAAVLEGGEPDETPAAD